MIKTMRLLGIAGIVATGLFMTACNKGATKLDTQKDKVSYIIGQNIGRSFKQQGLTGDMIDLGKLRSGVEDALAGKEGPITQEQMAEIMNAFQQQLIAHGDSVNKSKGAENLKIGQEFLAKNAKAEAW